MVQTILKLDVVPLDADLFELGADSLRLTSLVGRIRKAFKMELALGDVYSRPTAQGLCELVAARRRQKGRTGSLGGSSQGRRAVHVIRLVIMQLAARSVHPTSSVHPCAWHAAQATTSGAECSLGPQRLPPQTPNLGLCLTRPWRCSSCWPLRRWELWCWAQRCPGERLCSTGVCYALELHETGSSWTLEAETKEKEVEERSLFGTRLKGSYIGEVVPGKTENDR